MTEPRRLEVGGLSLEWRHVGPPPSVGPTIVLLHEGLGSLRQWKEYPERLSEATGCGVAAYSRSGYGRSSPISLPRPLDYLRREGVDVLPKVLDAIGVERAILFGHSDGASIATAFAGEIPDSRIRGLVLIAPHFFVEVEGRPGIDRMRDAYRAGSLRDRLARYHGDNVDSAFYGWSDTWLDPAFRDFDLRPALRRISIPILGVQGSADEYATRAQMQCIEDEARGLVEILWIEGAGHAPHVERDDVVLPRVAHFVQRTLFAAPEIGI